MPIQRPRLYYPVKPFGVNQHFGENKPCVRNFGLPNQEIVGSDPVTNVCPVGSDKLYAHFGMSGHNGTDLRAGEQNVYASLEGVVVEKQGVPARGLGLGILTSQQYDLDGNGVHFLKIRYWHLKTMYREVGDVVKPGDLIGVSDNTGYSSANHLHFEGQPMDKDAGGHPYLAFPSNGIGAAIDLEPYFVGTYAEDLPKLVSLYTMLIPLLQQLINYLKK
jgi:murein DD-endopeptidase MepM/ murein hydrolase activator NlpD